MRCVLFLDRPRAGSLRRRERAEPVWKSSVTDFVGMGYIYEQPRQHDQARSSHVLNPRSGAGTLTQRHADVTSVAGLRNRVRKLLAREAARIHRSMSRSCCAEPPMVIGSC
jgi:hypothetical protein